MIQSCDVQLTQQPDDWWFWMLFNNFLRQDCENSRLDNYHFNKTLEVTSNTEVKMEQYWNKSVLERPKKYCKANKLTSI